MLLPTLSPTLNEIFCDFKLTSKDIFKSILNLDNSLQEELQAWMD